eukprot:gnl/TRDRNA2_/TRDRNA2_155940_c1_seq2.p1 gnl/TRDRNA2_/TRDRNA2_155940_c1~~gnl/TRDRNA2_/TRDRNA2_155940_c1_seq2.p1  ORF type:complete len:412 (+),score=77.25 gnl/TRDRNA2_/TRDRNA2_155940_c1_seq2:60-1295(+)
MGRFDDVLRQRAGGGAGVAAVGSDPKKAADASSSAAVSSVATPARQRSTRLVSLSELYKMNLEELQRACAKEELDITGDETKGALMLRLRHQYSRMASRASATAAAAAQAAKAPLSAPQPAPASTIDLDSAAEPSPSKEVRSTDLCRLTVKELRAAAQERGIDTSGCVEKADIIGRLERGGPRIPDDDAGLKARVAPVSVKKRAKPAAAVSAATGYPAARAPAEPPQDKMRLRGGIGAGSMVAAPAAEQSPEEPDTADYWTSPSIGAAWSERIRDMFDSHPGFNAVLPPEAEMWTEQELSIYFGSNGEMWPRGKRPAWLGKPSVVAEQAKLPQPERRYTDLKQHFETLGLPETAWKEPDMIPRRYRRLSLEYHPDKHPGPEQERYAKEFKEIHEAYELLCKFPAYLNCPAG